METNQVGFGTVAEWLARGADQTSVTRRTVQRAALTRCFIRVLQAAFVGIILAQFSFDHIAAGPHVAPAFAEPVLAPKQRDDDCPMYSSEPLNVAGFSQAADLSPTDLRARFSKQMVVEGPLPPEIKERAIAAANLHKDIIDRIPFPQRCYLRGQFYDLSEQLKPYNFGVISADEKSSLQGGYGPRSLFLIWIDPAHPFAFVADMRLACGSFTDVTGEVLPACLLNQPHQASILVFRKGNELRFYVATHFKVF